MNFLFQHIVWQIKRFNRKDLTYETFTLYSFFTRVDYSHLFLFSGKYCMYSIVCEIHAVTQTQNLAESFLGSDGNFLEMKKHFPNAEYSDNSLALFFDKDWNLCKKDTAHFVATLDYTLTDNNLCTADISVSTYNSDTTKILYSIELIHHIKERRGDLE